MKTMAMRVPLWTIWNANLEWKQTTREAEHPRAAEHVIVPVVARSTLQPRLTHGRRVCWRRDYCRKWALKLPIEVLYLFLRLPVPHPSRRGHRRRGYELRARSPMPNEHAWFGAEIARAARWPRGTQTRWRTQTMVAAALYLAEKGNHYANVKIAIVARRARACPVLRPTRAQWQQSQFQTPPMRPAIECG
jgi:hypothetical protein